MPDKTQAAVLFETGKPLEFLDLIIPNLKPGQVLVDVAFSGVCHSQLNEVRGHKGPDRFLPHTLGHEGSGVVVAIGEGVTKIKKGDKVVLSWIKGRGADVPNTIYDSPKGLINSGAISTFMRQTVTCENRVTVIPEMISLRLAALLGCAIPTGVGVVFNTSGLQRGQSVAVFGVGGIGMSVILAAKLIGASPIIAIDIVPKKLVKAMELGATHVLDAGNSNLIEAIQGFTHGRGVYVAIECSGNPIAMEMAFKSVLPGGLCIIVGNPPQGQTISINPFDLIQGKRIVGSWGGETHPDTDIPKYVEMFLNGRLELEKLEVKCYSFKNLNRALDDLEAGDVVRAMICVND